MRRIPSFLVVIAFLLPAIAPATASADLRFVDCLGVRGFPQPACSTPPGGYGLPGTPVVSRDGRHLYVGFGQRTMVYARNAETGALSYVSCVDHYEPTTECPEYTPNSGALVETPDGRFLYAIDTYSLYRVTARLTRAGTRALRRRKTVSAKATVTLKRGSRRTQSVLRLKLAR